MANAMDVRKLLTDLQQTTERTDQFESGFAPSIYQVHEEPPPEFPTNDRVDISWAQSHKAVANRVGFLDLPREIRDLCYGFAFQLRGAVFIYSSDVNAYRPILRGKIVKYKGEGPLEPRSIGDAIPASLIRTCRQVHSEGTEVLYGYNVFRLYMSNADFASSYRTLIRHVTFTMEAGRGIYSEDLEVMCYWWRRVFWPNVIDRSTSLLLRYPNLELLTFPIKSNQPGQTWRPAFCAFEHKTKEQRIALAARWLRTNCPMRDEHLHQVLRLEIQPAAGLIEGSWFFPEEYEDEWDGSEFAQAWMLNL
ncbi:hypothetical protein K458DRAFT_446366 [Lentithecium fluviatile CBS 122367]|uniref:Uncharacterized protein n=1 Tax=Lentithecium fluviatile CBS 122367 TaxID=1168545 RepID=A0A6G1IKH8_9PLEO|nr:hypothetical protein K458DRAFT_446366 [Lentithecium fluviatile CBS 122367]